jgi:radical SAM superfamily enzyme YgiQ (UPF0313 family)
MIGLPTETDADIDEIVKLTLDLKERVQETVTRIAITVEPFVPKVGTPFQWLAMAPEDVLNERMDKIKSGLAKSGIEVRSESVGWSLVQGVLARGDAKLGEVLARMQRNSLAAWRRALEECDLSAYRYAHREMLSNERRPWSVVDSGVTSEYLKKEVAKARHNIESQPCPSDECHKCGVC